MASRMNEFKDFVSRHERIKEEVRNGNRTWQSIYEDWVILGEDEFKDFKTQTKTQPSDLLNNDSVRKIVDYVKKINPDSISKTLNTVQKVLQITQGLNGTNPSRIYNADYNSWWD